MALLDVLDVSAYAPEAVANANASPIAALSVDLLIVRAASAAADRRLEDARDALERAWVEGPVGRSACVVTSSLMFIAALDRDQSLFDRALSSWVGFRTVYPQDFDNSVVEAEELRMMLDDAPEDLVGYARTPVTSRERGEPSVDFMTVVNAGLAEWIVLAVNENAEWIDRPDPLAYALRSVNEDLREVNVTSNDGRQPELTIALNSDLKYMGAFISH